MTVHHRYNKKHSIDGTHNHVRVSMRCEQCKKQHFVYRRDTTKASPPKCTQCGSLLQLTKAERIRSFGSSADKPVANHCSVCGSKLSAYNSSGICSICTSKQRE